MVNCWPAFLQIPCGHHALYGVVKRHWIFRWQCICYFRVVSEEGGCFSSLTMPSSLCSSCNCLVWETWLSWMSFSASTMLECNEKLLRCVEGRCFWLIFTSGQLKLIQSGSGTIIIIITVGGGIVIIQFHLCTMFLTTSLKGITSCVSHILAYLPHKCMLCKLGIWHIYGIWGEYLLLLRFVVFTDKCS